MVRSLRFYKTITDSLLEFKDSIPDDVVAAQNSAAEHFGITFPPKEKNELRKWTIYRAYATIAQKGCE